MRQYGLFRALPPLYVGTTRPAEHEEARPRLCFGAVTRLQRLVLQDLALDLQGVLDAGAAEIQAAIDQGAALGVPAEAQARAAWLSERGADAEVAAWLRRQALVAGRQARLLEERKVERAAVLIQGLAGDWSLHRADLPAAPAWPALTLDGWPAQVEARKRLLLSLDDEAVEALLGALDEAAKAGLEGLTQDEKKP